MRAFCSILLAGLLLAVFSPANAATGTKWAVCIGISDYEDPDLVDLPHAANDARDLGRALKTRGGFDRVVVLTDASGSREPDYASRVNILKGLEGVATRLKPEDTLLVFFSGHGVTDPGGRSFLLPADAMVRNIPRTAVTLEGVQDFMVRSRAEERILFLDGARKEIWSRGPHLEAIYPGRYLRDLSAVFYAAKKGTYSHSHDQAPYGVFGGALIAGVQGEADRAVAGNRDGVVSLMELGAYVDDRVTAWSMSTGNRQSVYIRMFDSQAATLAMSRSEGAAEERVLAAVKTEPPAVPEERPAPRVEEPAPVKRPEPAPAKERKEPARAVAAPKPARTAKAPEPAPAREKAEAEGDVVIGAQAPSIDDVETEVRAAPSVQPPASSPKLSRVAPEDEKAMEVEAEDRGREARVMAGDEAPRVASVPKEEPAPPPVLEPVSLRAKPTDLTAEGVRGLLVENDFYATCWTYNGDFCNPTGEFENSYQDNGDGTVTDRRTRLMWQKAGAPTVLDWTEAGDYVKELNQEGFAGHGDWRLPTVEELASLMERSWENDDLFLAPVFTSQLKYCWSADTKGVERAWKGNFHLGFFLDFPMDDLSGVRAVRSVR